MGIDFAKFNQQFPADQMKKQIKEAKENSGGNDLPDGEYTVKLDKMELGDVFTLTVLDRTLTYQVDQILVVRPDEINDVQLVAGEDFCTLLTCTPYGVNSHRLLVRGTRVENEKQIRNIRVTADASIIEPILVAPFVAAPILLVLFVALMIPKPQTRREE